MANNPKQARSSVSCRSMEDVARYIEGMRFRKKLFGGLDEADVWKKIEALHKQYEAVFLAQELRHEQELNHERGLHHEQGLNAGRQIGEIQEPRGGQKSGGGQASRRMQKQTSQADDESRAE